MSLQDRVLMQKIKRNEKRKLKLLKLKQEACKNETNVKSDAFVGGKSQITSPKIGNSNKRKGDQVQGVKKKKKKKLKISSSNQNDVSDEEDGDSIQENSLNGSVESSSGPDSKQMKNKKKKKKKTLSESDASISTESQPQESSSKKEKADENNLLLPGSSLSLDLLKDSSFSTLQGHVCEQTLKAVEEMGFTNMTEIQAKSIPPLLEGRDIVARAKTGSGKTLAFLIPAIELIYKLKFMPRNGVGCLIISPTRELSMQTFGVLKELMAHHYHTYGLIMGGANRATEAQKLAKGINIIVATPGRLLDHLQNTPDFLYKNLQCLVIDEADRILQIGFEEDMKQIINLLPKRRQTMLFSATTTDKTEALTRLALKKEPVYVGVEDKTDMATVDGLEQGYVICPSEKRFLLLFTFLKKNRKKKVMVFFSSCLSVQFHHELLNFIDLNCMCIHGKQKQMKRTTTFFQFCNASEGILLCTDVAARGLDIPDVDWIVQFDPPDDPKEYIHRVGRTARGEGGKGHALLILRPEELGFLRYLKQARIPLNEFEFSWKKIADIQLQLEKLIAKNYFLNQSAKEAFKAYVRAYDSHHLKLIFDVATLDLAMVAKSFGFTVPPAVDLQVLNSKNSRPRKRTGGGGLGFYNNLNKNDKSKPNFRYVQPKR
ncbi:probable ATP-dependent RNA helicase pitchoune [Macrosteles quadrilineatus]|uniref:probable ATP-dependent RNA helicase pitchoune n=1 Tax=Macrosteles quadrilineatus TaxID=74068 RepID=UPI0023E31CA2|nr:probable ATP-dependent RNA helicase pitchoune [Macrosteles quadrilineatus]